MGCFSWIYCDREPGREENLAIGRKAYVFCPNGTVLFEPEYGGYGEFAGQDIYDLVAAWNRMHFAAHPEALVPQPSGRPARRIDSFHWYPAYADLSKSREDVEKETRVEWRHIGIEIACYNVQNAALPYPIKIAKAKRGRSYDTLPPSKHDPDQGMDHWVGKPNWPF